jgi:rRNA small subunit methyltransferase G
MFRELLRQRLNGLVCLTPRQLNALESHYQLLVHWNRVLNLTSIEEVNAVVERHYCESIFLAVHLPARPLRVADLGSGGGFPGLPLAVLRPDCDVTLVETHRRKAVFLRESAFDRVVSRGVSYQDLKPALTKLGRAADLLTGAEAPPADLDFVWEAPIRLPWGRNRFLRSGVQSVVPRETHGMILVSRGTEEST